LKPASKRFGCATLLAFDLVLFAPLLATGGVFSSHDFVRAHYPWRGTADGVLEAENRLLSDPAASGETTLVRYRGFPDALFWNPWVSSGAIGPFHLAQGFLSPFVVLPSLFLPESGIETGILFLKFNVAFIAMYAFLRGRRFSDLAASAGAAAWAFATGQTVWGLWMQSSVSVTYPLLLLAVDRAFEEAATARAIRFASLAILLCLSGGFPHWILYGAFAAGLYLALRALRGRREAGKALVRVTAGGAIAIAILFPSILATGRFLRASGYEDMRRGMGAAHALPLRHLRLYFLPDYYGSPRSDDYRGIGWIPGDNFIETAVGVGVAAGGLAFLGLAALRRRSEARFAALLAAAIAVPLYAGGPILSRIGGLPLLDISLFARAKILILLAVGILAACGAEALERLTRAEAAGTRLLAVRLLPFLVAVPLAFDALEFYPECRPAQAVFRDTPGIARLREETRGGGRFAAAGWTLIPNVSEALGLDDVRGHFLLDAAYRRLLAAADPRCFGRYGTYLVFDPETLDPRSPVLDLLGVGVLAAPPGVSSPVGAEVEARDAAPFEDPAPGAPAARDRRPPPLERIYDGPDLTLFRRPGAFPRFFFVSRALPGGAEEASRADRATLASAVFVAGADVARLEAGTSVRGAAGGSLRVTAMRPERFALETDSPRPTLLVGTQKRFPPYWRTYVDGRETPSFPADGPFLGLEVPAGRHTVEGRFVVPRRELAVSALGLLVLAAVLVRARNLPESASAA
jgi:hypothetical protein